MKNVCQTLSCVILAKAGIQIKQPRFYVFPMRHCKPKSWVLDNASSGMTARKLRCLLILMVTILFAMPALADTYPQDVRRAFTESCVGLNSDMITPCKCLLKRMEEAIPFKQYEQIIKQPDPMKDPRIAAITRQCFGER